MGELSISGPPIPLEVVPLPYRPEVGAGEALDSYLERLAAGNDISASEMLKFLRSSHNNPAASSAFLMVRPERAMRDRISDVGGISRAAVDNATLARYSHGLPLHLSGFDPRDRHSFRNIVTQGWFPTTGSQVCPHCLAQEPKWQLRWRLPIAVMCAEHGTLLVTQCRRCSARFRSRHYSPLRPHIGPEQLCGNQLGLRKHCDHPVLDHPTQEVEVSVAAMNSAVEQAMLGMPCLVFGRPLSGQVYLAELRHLATLLLHLASRERGPEFVGWAAELHEEGDARRPGQRSARWGISPPDGALVRGAALSAAHEIITQEAIFEGADLLSPWLELIADVRGGPQNWVVNRTVRSPMMEKLISATVQKRHHVGRRMKAATANRGSIALSAIPQMIDEDIYFRYFAGMLGGYEWTGRLYVSLCMARVVAGSSNWSDAAVAIGLDADLGRRTARAASSRMRVTPEVFAGAVEQAQRMLSPSRDFRKLETAVREIAATSEDWFNEWSASTTPSRRPTTLTYAVTWIWCTVAQGLLDTSPAWVGRPDFRAKEAYRAFSKNLPLEAQEQLGRLVFSQLRGCN